MSYVAYSTRPRSANERQLHRHRTRAGVRIGDARGESAARRDGLRGTDLLLDSAHRRGSKGLPISMLSRLLAKHRGVRNQSNLPRLAISKILEWADDFYERIRTAGRRQ
jgi:hypothetical protein